MACILNSNDVVLITRNVKREIIIVAIKIFPINLVKIWRPSYEQPIEKDITQSAIFLLYSLSGGGVQDENMV